MAEYTLSERADDDLLEIYLFSHQRFGEARADAYLLSLEECFVTLGRQPQLGRSIDHIRQGYFRYQHASHSIFYAIQNKHIKIMRVLHMSMDFARRLNE